MPLFLVILKSANLLHYFIDGIIGQFVDSTAGRDLKPSLDYMLSQDRIHKMVIIPFCPKKRCSTAGSFHLLHLPLDVSNLL